LPTPPLLVITDRRQAAGPLEDVLAGAFAAGCRWASIREKDLPAEEQIVLARHLRAIAHQWCARLTLHGDPALAAEAGLDGVHLSAGADAADARARVGRHALVGISVHSAEEAARLDAAQVDYAIAGPAYETVSKPGYGPALGMLGIRQIARAATVPLVAIGGITPSAVADMHVAGAVGIAIMGSVMRAVDPAAEIRTFLAAMTS
jgi:thiamine-phosphate pyrophosphorylase